MALQEQRRPRESFQWEPESLLWVQNYLTKLVERLSKLRESEPTLKNHQHDIMSIIVIIMIIF